MEQLTKTQFTALDFAENRQDFIDYLRTLDEFKGIDFEGAGAMQLLNILSLNTTKLAFVGNFVGNEGFLKSAQIRSSVVSNAEPLGFVPRSKTSPQAFVNIRVIPEDANAAPSTLNLDRGKKLNTIYENGTFTYSVMDTSTTTKTNDEYLFTDVLIREGTNLKNTLVYEDGKRRYRIPNKDIDTSSMIVHVQESEQVLDQTEYKYVEGEGILEVNNESLVYYLSQDDDGYYNIEFGDNVLGKSLVSGNIITVDYLVTQGDLSNGAFLFDMTNSVGGYSNVIVETVSVASGGSDEDDAENIKFFAPKAFQSQGSAVNEDDYINVVRRAFPDARSITSWDGQENIPVLHGKICIAIRPKTTETLPSVLKDFITDNVLKKKKVGAITPVIFDPEYTFLSITCRIEFDKSRTNKQDGVLIQAGRVAIADYSTNTLEKFGGNFRYSQLSKLIDKADRSFDSNQFEVGVKKEVVPYLGRSALYEQRFNNPIVAGSFKSTYFQAYNELNRDDVGNIHYLLDDGNGVLKIAYLENGVEYIFRENAGSIDYATGYVQMVDLNLISIDGITIDTTATIDGRDMDAFRNDILIIEDIDVKVKGV